MTPHAGAGPWQSLPHLGIGAWGALPAPVRLSAYLHAACAGAAFLAWPRIDLDAQTAADVDVDLLVAALHGPVPPAALRPLLRGVPWPVATLSRVVDALSGSRRSGLLVPLLLNPALGADPALQRRVFDEAVAGHRFAVKRTYFPADVLESSPGPMVARLAELLPWHQVGRLPLTHVPTSTLLARFTGTARVDAALGWELVGRDLTARQRRAVRRRLVPMLREDPVPRHAAVLDERCRHDQPSPAVLLAVTRPHELDRLPVTTRTRLLDYLLDHERCADELTGVDRLGMLEALTATATSRDRVCAAARNLVRHLTDPELCAEGRLLHAGSRYRGSGLPARPTDAGDSPVRAAVLAELWSRARNGSVACTVQLAEGAGCGPTLTGPGPDGQPWPVVELLYAHAPWARVARFPVADRLLAHAVAVAHDTGGVTAAGRLVTAAVDADVPLADLVAALTAAAA